MNKQTFAIFIAASLIGGCAIVPPEQKTWYKPGSTNDMTRRDMMLCRQYGMQSAAANGLSGNIFVESWIRRETDNCLVQLGYSGH